MYKKLHTDWYHHVQKKGKKEVKFDSVFTFARAQAHPVPYKTEGLDSVALL